MGEAATTTLQALATVATAAVTPAGWMEAVGMVEETVGDQAEEMAAVVEAVGMGKPSRPEPVPSRPEAIRLALKDWLTGATMTE